VLALAVVPEPARLQHAGQAQLPGRGAQLGERPDGTERRCRDLELVEQLLLKQAVLRDAQCFDRRPDRMRRRDLPQGRDRHVLEFISDDVDLGGQPLEALRIVERPGHDRGDLAPG
jgi:hypothetical protein